MKHHIKCKDIFGPTMQCISKTYYQMFQFSATVPNLCPQHKSSLINHLINDRSAECLTNHHSDVASTHQYLAHNVNRPAPIALPRFCNLRTKVCNVRKSQVGRCNWSPASRDKAARSLCVHGALARCILL